VSLDPVVYSFLRGESPYGIAVTSHAASIPNYMPSWMLPANGLPLPPSISGNWGTLLCLSRRSRTLPGRVVGWLFGGKSRATRPVPV
jgi:hypothetical protein